jgi:hypothetical protein
MVPLKELEKQRFEFLAKLYDLSGGSGRARILMWEVGQQLNFNKEVVANTVDYLQGENLIQHVALGGYIAITHAGKKEVEQALGAPDKRTEHFSPIQVLNIGTLIGTVEAKTDMSKTTNFNVATNYGQIGEVLNNCTNIINQRASPQTKDLLETLRTEVERLIKAIPPENSDVAQKASRNLQRLVETATEKNPDRDWYSVSAKGLIEASKFVKDFAGNIAGTIGQIGKLFWPDYSLPAQ